MRYALVKNDEVINVIEWDGVSEYTPPAGCTLLECTKHQGSEKISAKRKGDKFAKEEPVLDIVGEVLK